jgi:hypothetical protein
MSYPNPDPGPGPGPNRGPPTGDLATLRLAVNMVVMYTFAGLNMENYPPTPRSGLAQACAAITANPTRRGLRALLAPKGGCFNLAAQLPTGHFPTITGGDWSGVGGGPNGESWDFETCTLLVERIGTNNVTDMFPPRAFTLAWLERHCSRRFGVTPQPRRLANLWGLDRLQDVTSRIVFTNGLNDGWSTGSVLRNLSASLVAINMPNGAHHSDLSHDPPGPQDTPDVTAGRAQAATLLAEWLAEVKAEA